MIQIKEMGPRDGLQNEKLIVPTKIKVELIQKLEACGLSYIEVGAFVRADKIPQLADTENVLSQLTLNPQTQTSVLVPNIKGFEKALASGIKEIAVFTAASETFNQKNINASIEESLQRFMPVIEKAQAYNIAIRGYVSTAFVCPFEGDINPQKVITLTQRLLDMGCYEVSIGDTLGKASKEQVKALFSQTQSLNAKLAGHFHNTYDLALSNIETALDFGITVFDSSIGGLGGCPYAPGAGGNIGTEDLVAYLHQKNLETNIDLNRLLQVSQWLEPHLDHPLYSKTYQQHKKYAS